MHTALSDKSFEQFRRDFVESCVFRVRRKTSFEKLQTNDGSTLAFGDKLVLEHVFSERVSQLKSRTAALFNPAFHTPLYPMRVKSDPTEEASLTPTLSHPL